MFTGIRNIDRKIVDREVVQLLIAFEVGDKNEIQKKLKLIRDVCSTPYGRICVLIISGQH